MSNGVNDMNVVGLYLWCSVTVLVFFSIIWKASDGLNLLLKLVIVSLSIMGALAICSTARLI